MKSIDEFKTKEEYTKYLRTYFAAMAMQGVLASGRVTTDGHEWIAKQSIKNADELLKQLDQ